MVKEQMMSQVKAAVGLQTLWTALTVELRSIIAEVIPGAISSVELVEGDGGLGSVFLFNFGPHVGMKWQREKIVELDEAAHRVALQVIEGGHLVRGFTFYQVGFKLTADGEDETLVDVILTYELDSEASAQDPSQTLKSAEGLIYALDKYLQAPPPGRN